MNQQRSETRRRREVLGDRGGVDRADHTVQNPWVAHHEMGHASARERCEQRTMGMGWWWWWSAVSAPTTP